MLPTLALIVLIRMGVLHYSLLLVMLTPICLIFTFVGCVFIVPLRIDELSHEWFIEEGRARVAARREARRRRRWPSLFNREK